MATTMTRLETQTQFVGQDMLPVLHRLEQLLPLKARRHSLAPPLRVVHRTILRSLGETGKPPTQAEIAAVLGSRQSALYALAVLASNDLVILNAPVVRDEKTKQLTVDPKVEVIGAYPMTTENTPHRVVLRGHSVNAMCAVDALAISPLFGRETWIESCCHVTGTTLRILQHGTQILEASPSSEIRVGIKWQPTKSCAAHSLCTEMVFLRDAEVAGGWRNAQTESVDILSLSEAIELGAAFFLPLVED